MNRQEKLKIIKSAMAGNMTEVEKLLRSNEHRSFVEMLPELYCVSNIECDCCQNDCRYLKSLVELQSLYPNATYINIAKRPYSAEMIAQFERFEMPLPEFVDPLQLRNMLLQLKNKLNE